MTPGIVDGEDVGEKAQPLEPGRLLEIGAENGLELALVDGAAPQTSSHVGRERRWCRSAV